MGPTGVDLYPEVVILFVVQKLYASRLCAMVTSIRTRLASLKDHLVEMV